MSIVHDEPGQGSADNTERAFSVFISYRRGDTGQSVETIRKELALAFGEDSVYLDSRQEPGVEWLENLRAHGQRADVFLALIGPLWFDELRRRAGTVDYVRKEVEWALRDWPGHIVPVLIGADVPETTLLPRSIRALFGLQLARMQIGAILEGVDTLVKQLRAKQASGERPMRTLASSIVRPSPTARDPADPAGEPSDVPAPGKAHYDSVIAGMLAGEVVPVLGSGAHGSPPESRQLVDGFARRYSTLAAGVVGLPEVAQRVWTVEDEAVLIGMMRELLHNEPQPSAVHQFLAGFPQALRRRGLEPAYQLVLTTSYDRSLECAFEQVNEPFDLVAYVRDLDKYVLFPWGEGDAAPEVTEIDPDGTSLEIDDNHRLDRTMIVRLHGTSAGEVAGLTWNDGYIVTEDDYIDYAPAKLPRSIVSKLTWNRCLFLGYQLSEWSARVLLRRVWTQRRSRFWAIEEEPNALESTSWQKVPQSVLLSQPLGDYAAALAEAFERATAERPS